MLKESFLKEYLININNFFSAINFVLTILEK